MELSNSQDELIIKISNKRLGNNTETFKDNYNNITECNNKNEENKS